MGTTTCKDGASQFPVRFGCIAALSLRGIAITSFVGSLVDDALCRVPFRPRDPLRRARQSGCHADHGICRDAGRCNFGYRDAIGLDAVAAAGDGLRVSMRCWRWDASFRICRVPIYFPAWPVSALVLVSAGGLWIAFWRARWRWLGLFAIAAGLAVAVVARLADLLVARDGETIALRGKDGVLHLLRPAADVYSAAEWLKRDGDGRAIAAGDRDTARRCDLRRIWLHRPCTRRRNDCSGLAGRCAGGGLRACGYRSQRRAGSAFLRGTEARDRPLRRRAPWRLCAVAGKGFAN